MRVLGLALIVLCGIVFVDAWNADTTVETGGQHVGEGEFSFYIPRTRVHNIGLIDQRRSYLMVSGGGIMAGLILFGFGQVLASQAHATTKPYTGPKCPVCRGPIEGESLVCMHCRAALKWIDGQPLLPEHADKILADRKAAEKKAKEQRVAYWAERDRQAAERKREVDENWENLSRNVKNFLSWVSSLPMQFDNGMRHLLGEENDLVYRFVQCLLYVGLPAALLVLWLTRVL